MTTELEQNGERKNEVDAVAQNAVIRYAQGAFVVAQIPVEQDQKCGPSQNAAANDASLGIEFGEESFNV